MDELEKTGDDLFIEQWRKLSPEKKIDLLLGTVKEQEEQNKALVKKSETLEQKVEENQEKASVYDVVDSSDALFTMQQVAKMTNCADLGPNNLFDLLCDTGYLYRPGGMKAPIPFQKHVPRYFTVKRGRWTRPDGSVEPYARTMVTQKGVHMIVTLAMEYGYDVALKE